MSEFTLSLSLLSLAAFVALALGMDKHWRQVTQRELTVARRVAFRIAGWTLLTAALALGVAGWGESIGIVVWLGWLSIVGLALVFSLPKFSREKAERLEREPAAVPVSFVLPGQRLRPLQWVAAIALALTPLLFAWRLQAEEVRPLLREDALRGQVGPWSFVFAEADRGPPELAAMNVPIKSYQIRFCDACDREIRIAYLSVNQPPSSRAPGKGFESGRRERRTEIQLPSTLDANSRLWLTVEGNDGSMHQVSWQMNMISPATVAWFEARRRE